MPQPARAEIGLPGPLLDLPTDGAADRLWQYFSTDGFYEIPIGNSTFDMPAVDDLRGGMSGFPDRASVEKLRYYGIRTVVLHLRMPKPARDRRLRARRAARPAAAAAKPIAGPRRHAPAGRLARDLRDRPRARGAARNRLMAAEATPPARAPSAAPPAPQRRAARLPRARRAQAPCALRCWRSLLVGLAYATMIQSFSWNQTSHYDLIRSLDNGRTTIDAYQANTGDKVFYKGHYYSARAPGLALFALPFYDALNLVDADSLARAHRRRQRSDDEMIYLIGLWGNVLPGLLLLLLVWRVAERFEPGYGAAARGDRRARHDGAAALHAAVLARVHGVARLRRVRADAARARRAARAAAAGARRAGDGLRGRLRVPARSSSRVVLGLYLLSRRDALTPRRRRARAPAPTSLGGLIGIVPLLLYNHYAFHSWTHLAYSDVPRQQKGFFGIGAPSLKVLATLLFDSRGLLTISPVLLMGAIGTVLLYRRGRRAEALTIDGRLPLLPGLQLAATTCPSAAASWARAS